MYRPAHRPAVVQSCSPGVSCDFCAREREEIVLRVSDYTSATEDRLACDSCASWHWMSSAELQDLGTVQPVLQDEVWPDWMIGFPDMFDSSPVPMESPWFRKLASGSGQWIRADLCGNGKGSEHPF